MRDPQRITRILDLIYLQSKYSALNHRAGRVEQQSSSDPHHSQIGYDLFQLEDKAFENFLESTLSEKRTNNKNIKQGIKDKKSDSFDSLLE